MGGILRYEDWANEDRGFLLNDKNLMDTSITGEWDPGTWTGKWRGRMVATRPDNLMNVCINPCMQVGGFNKTLLSFSFGAHHKLNWRVYKIKEILDIPPEYSRLQQTYINQKEQLESKIKQALVSISQSISDLELLEHDLRKYYEFRQYLEDLNSPDPKKRDLADRFLKMIFVEQVDYHVGSQGQGPGRFSMAFLRNQNIMPTIVDDFLMIKKVEDVDDVLKDKISGSLRNVLLTKFRAYEEWLKMFKDAVYTRIDRLEILKRSREKTVDEFRLWAKPYIAKYKMLEELLEHAEWRKNFSVSPYFHRTHDTVIAFDMYTYWLVSSMPIPQDRPEARDVALDYEFTDDEDDAQNYTHPMNPFNKWNQENIYYNYDYGLAADYPWITDKWTSSMARAEFNRIIGENKFYVYHTFFILNIEKGVLQADPTKGTAGELDDMEYYINPFFFSHNVTLAKMVEMKAMQEEFEKYVNEFLGLKYTIPGRSIAGYYKSGSKYVLAPNFVKKFLLDSMNKNIGVMFSSRVNKSWEELTKLGYNKEEIRENYLNGKFEPEIELSKKDFEKVFPESEYKYVEHKRDNKILKYIEDKFLGFPLFVRTYSPYVSVFEFTVTKVFYKEVGAKFNSLKDLITAPVKIPGPKGF